MNEELGLFIVGNVLVYFCTKKLLITVSNWFKSED